MGISSINHLETPSSLTAFVRCEKPLLVSSTLARRSTFPLYMVAAGLNTEFAAYGQFFAVKIGFSLLF